MCWEAFLICQNIAFTFLCNAGQLRISSTRNVIWLVVFDINFHLRVKVHNTSCIIMYQFYLKTCCVIHEAMLRCPWIFTCSSRGLWNKKSLSWWAEGLQDSKNENMTEGKLMIMTKYFLSGVPCTSRKLLKWRGTISRITLSSLVSLTMNSFAFKSLGNMDLRDF